MQDKEFLQALRKHIDMLEEAVDGECGRSRSAEQLLNEGKMPEVYLELLRRIELEQDATTKGERAQAEREPSSSQLPVTGMNGPAPLQRPLQDRLRDRSELLRKSGDHVTATLLDEASVAVELLEERVEALEDCDPPE